MKHPHSPTTSDEPGEPREELPPPANYDAILKVLADVDAQAIKASGQDAPEGAGLYGLLAHVAAQRGHHLIPPTP